MVEVKPVNRETKFTSTHAEYNKKDDYDDDDNNGHSLNDCRYRVVSFTTTGNPKSGAFVYVSVVLRGILNLSLLSMCLSYYGES